jgi:thiosulfate dehydrogenase
MMIMKHKWLVQFFATAMLAAGLCILPIPQNPASAELIPQEKEVLEGKEHEFGDAFIVSLGGKLYDDFWQGSGANPPMRRNPAFPSDITTSDTDSWRCVSCHGWDYDGADKAPGSEQQRKQYISLRHLQRVDPFKVTELFSRAHADHPIQQSGGLPLDLLVLFVSVGQYETRNLESNKSVMPEHFNRGRDIFEGVCMSCHDPDGKSGFEMRPGPRRSLGWLARNRPKRTMHKIINGVPGQSMLALRFLEEAVITDLLAYLRTLDP